MSKGLPYLKATLKGKLQDYAKISDLKDYEGLNKKELEVALDDHLVANRSIFAGDERLAEFYKRLNGARLSSPVKKEPKTEVAISADETVTRPARRRQTKARTGLSDDDDTDADKTPTSTTVATRTPGRSPLSFASSLPPSPAIVTDAIDRQTTIVRKSLSDAWMASGISERSDALRAILSSVKSIETAIILLEGFGILKELVPLRFLTTVPAIDAVHSPEFGIKLPDLFVLLSGSFWAPFSLWSLTSLILPLTFAYFVNLSYRTPASSHSYSTRRSSPSAAAATSFDPLVYNIAKALISYLVYANHFTFWAIYSHFSVEKVNLAIPGQWPGLVTGSGIGLVVSLYDAILKK